ncbi:MAG: DNA polymerase I [Roseiflexaceae bacterium]
MTDRPLLALIDGHALAFRAFHALSDAGLRSSSGEPTYAVFGFVSILLNAIESHHPRYVAVAFDVGRTFRDDLYAEYKAGRGEAPDEFHQQLDRIQQLVRAFNIPIYTAEGYEADDVIGTLARQATAQGVDTIILTGDTDTLQLVDAHVMVLLANPYGKKTTTTLYDEEQVVERYKGLRPSQLADLRGLKGDTSDNIPGVKGIGESGAIALLNQFGSVENLYDQLDEAPKRYRKPLEGQREAALFSKRIATIVCDVPIALDLRACELRDYDRAAVIALFQELELGAGASNLIKRLPVPSGGGIEVAELPATIAEDRGSKIEDGTGARSSILHPPSSDSPQQLAMFDLPPAAAGRPTPLTTLPGAEARAPLGDYRAVRNEDELRELLAALSAAPAFAFDTETEGLRPFQDELVGISLAVEPGQAWYVPIGHREEGQLPRERVLDALRPFFADPNKRKFGHNAKFDIEFLLNAGVEVAGVAFDTTIAAALLDKRKGLKELAFYELKLPEPMTDIGELIGKGKSQILFSEVPIELATPYAAADADMTLRLVAALEPQLARLSRVQQIFARLEMPLLPVLVGMEQAGIGLDAPFMLQLGRRMGDDLARLEDQIYAFNDGAKFNINSGDQLSTLLFEKLGLPTEGVPKTDKTKKYSLTAGILEGLRSKDERGIIELILRYRQLTKLKSTYVDALPALVNPRTGRVHTSYNQIGSATGRLSSNDPNLQNIPTRTDEGREIRRGFVAAPGHVFVAADYSQIELRVLAHITQDPNLMQAFKEDQDIHAATAAQLFNVPIGSVSKNQRRIAKCVAAGTLVNTNRGIISIEQLGNAEVGDVAALTCVVAQEGHKQQAATGFYNGGVQPTIRITTERGYVLEATAQHRVRTLDAQGNYVWKRLDELVAGDYAALARGGMLFGTDRHFDIVYTRRNDRKLRMPDRLTPSFARFLGYFIAEGNYRHGPTSSTVVISNTDPTVLADLRRLSSDIFGALPAEAVDRNGVTSMQWHCSRLVELLLWLGIEGGAANKRIPDVIMQASYESVTEFLRAFYSIPKSFVNAHGCLRRAVLGSRFSVLVGLLYEGDGSISKSFISAASKSYTLIHQLQVLLLNFGIVSRIEHRDIPKYGRHYKLLVIGRDSRTKFAEHIGFIIERKHSRLRQLVERQATHEQVVLPAQQERLLRMYPKTKRELKETVHTCIRTKSPAVALTYRRLASILERFPEPEDVDCQALFEHQQRNLFYDRVASIEHGQSHVFDLVVPATNTYIANGFVSHNTTVFGVIYGISAFGLAARTDLSRTEAQQLIDALFTRFPGLRDYIDSTLAEGRQQGYVHSLFGRRRTMPDLTASGPRRQAAEREAINAPIQSTAADIMKIAMIRVDEELRRRGLATRMLLQVHDELIFEVPHAEVEELVKLVCEQMEGAYPELRVRLKVDVEQGPNWEEMTDVVVA